MYKGSLLPGIQKVKYASQVRRTWSCYVAYTKLRYRHRNTRVGVPQLTSCSTQKNGIDTTTSIIFLINSQNILHTGTQNVVDACVQNVVSSLVYTSTEDVVMGQDFFTNGDESLPYPTEFMYDDYTRTKCEAEKMVLEADQTVLENGTEQDLFSALLTWEGGGIISRLRKHYYFEVIVHRHDDCITSILYEHKMTLVCLKTS